MGWRSVILSVPNGYINTFLEKKKRNNMRRRKTFKKFSSIKVINKEKVKECMKHLHPMALGVMVSETNKMARLKDIF